MLHCCECESTASDTVSNSVDDCTDPMTVPASELVDISHQLHQQLTYLVVSQSSAFEYSNRFHCSAHVLTTRTTTRHRSAAILAACHTQSIPSREENGKEIGREREG